MMVSDRQIAKDELPLLDNDRRQMRRIAAAGFTGTVIEYFDLQVYSIAAAIVFAHLFFPQLGKAAGTVAAFGTIGVVFVARPLGSLIFGHFGDRIGRKHTLVISLVMMGLSTVLVGLLPTSAQIGVAAPILLVLLRVIQGIAAGGEFAGAALLISENAPPGRRGFWSSMPSVGGAVAISSGALAFTVTSMTMSADAFRTWGWRLPFLASTVLLVVGLYIRMKMEETPVFAKQVSQHGVSRVPIADAFRTQPLDILLGCMVSVPAFSMLYLVMTYVVNFGANNLHLGYTAVTVVSVVSGLIMIVGVLAGSSLSDLIGRRPTLIAGNGFAALWSLALFPTLHHGSMTSYSLTILVTMLVAGFVFGPVGAFMSELFDTRYRYTAIGVCYNAAGIVGGALPPLFAGPVIASYGAFAFGKAMGALCLVSLVCTACIRETRHRKLDVDGGVPQAPAVAHRTISNS
ncbi:MFS transporter [Paraburkholderia sp. SIMBA_053]|uniref:MFS transporter n=1 Tax=Paraburkholderia sp. SIMBA_053 TaxID=3085794 RepID=UPI00397DE952